VEVSAGVTTDDRLIDNPSASLLEGEPVRIVTPAPGYKILTPHHEPVVKDHEPVGEAVPEEAEHEPQKAL
jgi:hypothetical protein